MQLSALYCLLPLFILGSVAADLTYTVNATKDGKPVPESDIVLTARPSRSHTLINSTASAITVKGKRANPVSYSSNWCGASTHSTSSQPITSVFGYFTAPVAHVRASQSTPQWIGAWIGIDGASCSSTVLQAGISATIDSSGIQTTEAWYEWVPNAAVTLTSFPVSPGDFISLNVSASSTTSGRIDIANLDQAYTMTITLSNGPTLCRVDAEWIVERPNSNVGLLPFPTFDDIWFESAVAKRSGGTDLGIDSSTMVYLGSTASNALCLAEEYDNADFYAYSQGS